MAPRKQRNVRKPTSAPPPAPTRLVSLPPARALMLPLTFTLALFTFPASPTVRQTPGLLWAFVGAGGVLLGWILVLLVARVRTGRRLQLEVVPRKQHYMQACAQSAVLLYWGWHWREVYSFAYLIAAQIVFAYAFDALLTWSRRDTHTLGFGPFPIILSTNLFLWFKPDWFYLQFLMVALGFAAKALIQWTKNGRPAHIFNPSSFPLSVFSLVLIATGSTHLTFGEEIATTQLIPSQIYLLIFLVSLPGQFLFGVASMTLAAASTTLAFGLLHHAATGSYLILEPSIPIAVFLGMHLLFTDPSTSPRTELGRLIFGILYGLSIVALFALLERIGAPTFYDKLLGVPILNLLIQWIDRAASSPLLRRVNPAEFGKTLTPRGRHLAYIGAWAAVFVAMQAFTASGVRVTRGDILLSLGRIDEAVEQFEAVVRADSDSAIGLSKLGLALSRAGRFQQALPSLQRAAQLQPENPDSHLNLGSTLLQVGRPEEAVPELEKAIELRPDYHEARYNLAQAFVTLGRPGEAVHELREALRVRPDWPPALEALAWVQATEADVTVRDPEEAIRLASRAADLSGRLSPTSLDTLAAAYAAAGRFEDAARTAEAALAVNSSPALAADIKARLSLYRAGQPLVNRAR